MAIINSRLLVPSVPLMPLIFRFIRRLLVAHRGRSSRIYVVKSAVAKDPALSGHLLRREPALPGFVGEGPLIVSRVQGPIIQPSIFHCPL